MRLRRHLEHSPQDLITRWRISLTVIARTLSRKPGQDLKTPNPMIYLRLLSCVGLMPCAMLLKLERHSASRPAKEEAPRLYPSWRSHPVGWGPTTPASIVGAWSKVRPGPFRAAFVIHVREDPYMNHVHPRHNP